jgi:hypothetical protein
MSETLHDTIGDSEVSTSLHVDGDRWISRVTGGVCDGYTSVMDKAGSQAVLHASVVQYVREGGGT